MTWNVSPLAMPSITDCRFTAAMIFLKMLWLSRSSIGQATWNTLPTIAVEASSVRQCLIVRETWPDEKRSGCLILQITSAEAIAKTLSQILQILSSLLRSRARKSMSSAAACRRVNRRFSSSPQSRSWIRLR
jgi:hypothetical protein